MQRLMTYLAEQRAAAYAELRRTVPIAANAFGDLDDAEWEALGRQLLDAAELLVAAVAMARRPPRTTVCVCPKCKTIAMPVEAAGEVYGHCGRLWFSQGRAGHLPIAANLWDRCLPGEEFKGSATAAWAEPETVDENATAAVERSKKGLKANPVKKRKTAKPSSEAV